MTSKLVLLAVICGLFSAPKTVDNVFNTNVCVAKHGAMAGRRTILGQYKANEIKVAVKKLAGMYADTVENAAKNAHVSPVLVAAVLHVESGSYHNSAHLVSSSGAIGPMQLMPATAWDTLNVNPWNPVQNINGGARLLHKLISTFHGNTRLALVAYNAGPTITAAGHAPKHAWAYARTVLSYVRQNSEQIPAG